MPLVVAHHRLTEEMLHERERMLRTVPYFAVLNRRVLQEIADRAQRRTYLPGEMIFLEGDPCAGLFIIESGQVKAFKTSSEGREQTLHALGPGQSFNDVAVLDGGSNPANAIALEEAVIWRLAREDVRQLANSHPELAWGLLEHVARRARFLVSVVEDLGLRSVKARLAKLLLEEAQRSADAGSVERSHLLTQQEMASRLGTVREMVGRALRSLAQDGAIRIDRHRIEVIDRAELEAQAQL